MNQTLRKTVETQSAIASWHQLLRFVSIQLTIETGKLVTLVLTRQRQRDPDFNFNEDLDQLLKGNLLTAEFELPGLTARILLKADFARRTVELSSRLNAPADKSRPKSSIHWFVKQLREAQELDPLVRVFWPRSSNPSSCQLSELETQGSGILVSEARKNSLPASFEVAWVIDLGARFKGTGTFVDDVTGAVPRFYEIVSERLKEWAPKGPPKSPENQTSERDSKQGNLQLPHSDLAPKPEKLPEPPPEVFRIIPTREKRYLDDRYN